MSKTRDTGFLGNVVKVDTSGNVSFVSGSTTLATINTSGQLSGSSPVLSSSYASNAETLDGLDSTVFTLTSSFAAQTASFTAFSSSINSFSASILSYTASQNITNGTFTTTASFNAQTASFTAFTASILAQTASLNAFSASVLTFTGSAATRLGALESYTSSLNDKTSSFATTGSNNFIGTQTISGSVLQSGSFTSTGTLTAQTLVVQTITSSIVYSSGSNIFGNALNNSQTFTGSVLVTGSLTLTGPMIGSSTACFSGTLCANYLYSATSVVANTTLFTGADIRKLSNNQCIFFKNAAGDNEMTIGGTGNVGIGNTGNSSRKLEVSQPTGYSAGVRIIADSNADAKLQFLGTGGSSQPDIGVTCISPNDLQISTGGCERMRITSTGQVSIGATSNLNNFTIKSSSDTITSGGLSFQSRTCVTNYIAMGLNSCNDFEIQTWTAPSWITRLYIKNNGNIGIGTTVGTAALGIGGSGAQTTANLTDGGTRIGIIESIPIGGEAGNGGALVLGSDTWGNGAGRGQIALKALLINGSGCGTSDLAFSLRNDPSCSNLTERMRITSAGNVGIGTCCPLGIINNKGVQIDQGGHTTLMLGSGIINGGVIQASDDARRIFIGANMYDDVTNSWSQFCDCSGFAAMDVLGYPDFGMARILAGKPNQSGYSSDHIFFEAMNCNTSSYLKLRTATDNALYITNCGTIGFGEASPGNDKMVIFGNNMHSNVWLRLKTAGCHGTKPAIHFDSGLSGTNYASKVIIMGGYSSPDSGAGGALVFYTNDTGETSQQRMCIDPRGAVTIMGALAKGSGSFRICHPLSSKVNTHALVHSFIEGPNADLIYSGHTKLIGGVSCINIDCISRMTEGTFEALNRCVRIFTTNESSWSAVKGKVCGNIVIIESQNNTSEDEISWMVIGERHDQHMFDTEWTDNEGRVITEPELVIVNDDDIVA